MTSRLPKPDDGPKEYWQIDVFEEGAEKCGFTLDYDSKEGKYEDCFLQAAWEVFINIDVNTRGYF